MTFNSLTDSHITILDKAIEDGNITNFQFPNGFSLNTLNPDVAEWLTFNSLTDSHGRHMIYIKGSELYIFQFPNGFSHLI